MNNRVILVVDDNKVSRMLPAFMLRSFPVKVLECETGGQALALLAQHEVSHVLLDISMPESSGLEVAQTIRDMPDYSHVKLVAYTADARTSQMTMMKSTFFDDVLIKPIRRLELLSALSLPVPDAGQMALD